ncbi:MAG: alkaline phosphatase family protein [Planctomycetota bacterium]
MRQVLAYLACVSQLAAPGQDSSPPRVFRNAVLVSVDGLRSDALIAVPAGELPAFTRMMQGASTLNARTDPEFTVTLPNHTAMFTGRFTYGGRGHGWVDNEDPPPGATLHSKKGEYICGMFDVAHDRGWRTAMYVGKSKFSLYDVSWDGEHGAPDRAGADQGRDKIDEYGAFEESEEIADAVLRALKRKDGTGSPGSLVFAHFAVTDLVGHEHGWDLTPGSEYMQAVGEVERELRRILNGIEAEKSLRGSTVVVLTSDHGGGAPFQSHTDPTMWVDYIIPFLVWTGDSEPPRELYEINAATRKDPGLKQPPRSAVGLPPIRNGDAGNLVLALLALPPVPGSTLNAKQDLAVFAQR